MLHPPPYIPPEFARLTYDKMPEPYRSQIIAWIAMETADRRQARRGALINIAGMSLTLLALAALLIAVLSKR